MLVWCLGHSGGTSSEFLRTDGVGEVLESQSGGELRHGGIDGLERARCAVG